MLGSILGDIIGSRFEGRNYPKINNFLLFNHESKYTDDTVLTCAVADVILNKSTYNRAIRSYYHKYPYVGYGSAFKRWAKDQDAQAYNSFGNGSAMRVSPIAFSSKSLDEVLLESKKSAEVTHNHPEGIKGAQAIASATYLAFHGSDKKEIEKYMKSFGYDTDVFFTSEHNGFDCSCQETVPQAITAFLSSHDFESCIRDAILMGGDSDTIAAMAGSIAHAYYKDIPQGIIDEAFSRIPNDLADITCEFMKKYVNKDFECTIRMNKQNEQNDLFRSIFS